MFYVHHQPTNARYRCGPLETWAPPLLSHGLRCCFGLLYDGVRRGWGGIRYDTVLLLCANNVLPIREIRKMLSFSIWPEFANFELVRDVRRRTTPSYPYTISAPWPGDGRLLWLVSRLVGWPTNHHHLLHIRRQNRRVEIFSWSCCAKIKLTEDWTGEEWREGDLRWTILRTRSNRPGRHKGRYRRSR